MAPNFLSGAVRKCVHGSFRIFESIPKEVGNECLSEEYRKFIVNQSQSFREALSGLNADINAIAESLDSEMGDGANIELDREYDLVCNLEQSWHICEVFLLNPTKHISIEMARWLKASLRQYPLDLAVESMKLFDQPELLKANPSDPTTFSYWEVVGKMVLQGETVLACEALALHSEISQAINTNTVNRAGITRAHCQLLFDALLTHPYAAWINSEVDDSARPPQQSMVVQFKEWANSVKKLRTPDNPLLLRIPELDTILRILLGETAAIAQVAGDSRQGVTLGLLLYVYPPPLSRTNLSQIVDEALGYVQSGVEDESDRANVATIREVMSGNIGPLLKTLYEQGARYYAAASRQDAMQHSAMQSDNREVEDANTYTVSIHSVQSDIALVSLLSVAHLSLLLVHGADKTDLTLRLGDAQNCSDEASFVEQLFLEAASKLNQMEFSVEVILGYLSVCPDQGRHFARALLTRRRLVSDDAVVDVSNALHALDWEQEAVSVLLIRAAYWLQMAHPIYGSSAWAATVVIPHTDVVADCLRSESLHISTVSKAVYFLQLACDFQYIEGLLDRSLYRCMCAVTACSALFPGLTMFPMAPVPPDSHAFTYKPESPDAKTARKHSVAEDEALIRHLESVLQEASDILEVLYASDDVMRQLSGSPRCAAETLRTYTTVVRTRLYEGESVPKMFGAAVRINGMLSEDREYPLVPFRYYLHLLNLSNWYAVAVNSLKQAQRHAGAASTVPAPELFDGELLPPTESYVYSKADAQKLLACLTLITTSSARKRFLAGAGANEEELQALQLALLGQLTNSLVQDNADSHATRMFINKLSGGKGEPWDEEESIRRADLFLRNKVPLAFDRGDGKQHSFFRAAGYAAEPVKGEEIRREMEVSEYIKVAAGRYDV